MNKKYFGQLHNHIYKYNNKLILKMYLFVIESQHLNQSPGPHHPREFWPTDHTNPSRVFLKTLLKSQKFENAG